MRTFALLVVATLAMPALAQWSVSDDPAPPGLEVRFNYASGDLIGRSFMTTANGGGVKSQDYMYQNWWWYRLEGETAETAFPWTSAGPDVDAETMDDGQTGDLIWDSKIAAFDATLSHSILDTGFDQSILTMEMTITNTGSAPLTLSLFNFADMDIRGSFDDDIATLVGSDIVRYGNTVADPYPLQFVDWQGVDADAYQAVLYGSDNLNGALTDGAITNLDNTLPVVNPEFGADLGGAFQWNLTIAPGASTTVTSIYGFNEVIPEPGTLSLLAVAGLALLRRRA